MFGRRSGEDIVVGLDIGTSKICVVVAEKNENGEIKIIGSGIRPSHGLRKGLVVNVESTVESIIEAVADAEKMSKTEIHSVYASITGSHIKSINSRGSTAITSRDGVVTDSDIKRVIDKACEISLPAGKDVIHSLPQEYLVDGQDGIKNPKGMVGNQLDVNVYIIAGSVVSERNIVKTIANAGFEVEGLVVQSLASSMVALKQEERDSGVLLIDMGGGTTDIIVFIDGLVRHSEVISIGGDHVTNDISIGLRVSIPIAERIKRKHACALKSMVGRDEEFFVEGAIGKDKIRMSRKKLAEIVEMRMEEAFGIIKKRVERYEGLLSSGVVLTGGCCNLPGVRELAKSKLKMAVRIGKPLEVSGLAEILDSPVSTTCVGLVKFGFTYGSELKYFSFSPINLLKKVFSYGISLFRRKIFYKKEG